MGSSKLKSDILSQIQPRTATPTHSSSIGRSMVSAVDNPEDSIIGANNGERKIEERYREDSNASDTFGRLSISGRLSLNKAPLPVTPSPTTTDLPSTYHQMSLFSAKSEAQMEHKGETDVESLKKPTSNLRTDDLIKDRFATSTTRENMMMEGSRSAKFNTKTANDSSNANVYELVKSFVEKSISETMSEVRNDVQNLHIEFIKQSLAQQNMMRQILSSIPDNYKKLADDFRLLQEENERLKLRLGI